MKTFKILPIEKLEDIEYISRLCKESKTPIIITENGYSDMVLISAQLYNQTIAKIQVALLLNEAIDDSNRNNDKKELNSFINELVTA